MLIRDSGKVLSELSGLRDALSAQLPTAQKIHLTINAGTAGHRSIDRKWQVSCWNLFKGDLDLSEVEFE
jgi:hypothetical protein